jgi:hypothetical protein
MEVLASGGGGRGAAVTVDGKEYNGGRGLHSFPFQLNLSASVHHITQINSKMYPGVAQIEL